MILHRTGWPLTIGISLGIAAAVVAPGSAGTASAAVSGGIVITAFSDPANPVGKGVQQEFDHTNASFTGTVLSTYINLSVSGGTASIPWTFLISPPSGTSFHVGYYPRVQGFSSPGYAGLSVGAGTSGCDAGAGGIDIRDLALSGSAIVRLDLLYEQHCGTHPPAAFGEIRIGEPRTSGVIGSSAAITWPSQPGIGTGGSAPAVPVYIRDTTASPVLVGTASLRGLGAGNYSLASDSCSGVSLQPGGFCGLSVQFTASTQGPRPAVLQVPLGAQTYRVRLDALVRPGITSLTMHSQPGEYIGAGQDHDFTSANATFGITGSAAGLSAVITQDTGVVWHADMNPPAGDVLTVGTYANAQYPVTGSSPGLLVESDSRGCSATTGSFTVKQAAFSGADSSIKNLDATFTQYCDKETVPLTGELKYDAEPVTSAPAPVSGLTATPTASGLKVTWSNPAISAYRYTVIRIEPSGKPAGVAPFAGAQVYAGGGTSAVAYGLRSGHAYLLVAYTVDQYGNVSSPAKLAVTA